MYLFCYRRDNAFEAAVLIEATDVLDACLKAASAGPPRGCRSECFRLADAAKRHIPKRFIDRLLGRPDLAELERRFWRKKPPAGSVRRAPRPKQRAARAR